LAFLVTGGLWIATGLFVLWMGVAQLAFLLLCPLVRRELAAGTALDELIVPKVIRAGIATVMMGLLGGLLVAQVAVPDALILVWLLLLVVGGRSVVRACSARHRRR